MPPAPSSSNSSGAIFYRAAMTSLLAGASVGIISDGVTHPISTAKSRLQVSKIAAGTKPPSTSAILMAIVRNEGWTKLYAGFGTVTVAAPARAMYFLGSGPLLDLDSPCYIMMPPVTLCSNASRTWRAKGPLRHSSHSRMAPMET